MAADEAVFPPELVTHLLRVSPQHLQLLGTGACANRERQCVVELVHYQVQVDGLFPVDLGVADRELLGVFAEDLDVRLRENSALVCERGGRVDL